MTITMQCQYTGLEFEASSKRQKNHPLVSKFLEEASKDRFHAGAYQKAKQLLAEAKGQFDNIDDLMQAVREAFAAWCNGEAEAKVRVVRQWKPMKRSGYDPDREMNDLDDYAQYSHLYQK